MKILAGFITGHSGGEIHAEAVAASRQQDS